jgi:hypothetical protein
MKADECDRLVFRAYICCKGFGLRYARSLDSWLQVNVTTLYQADAPALIGGATTGARTAWHIHPPGHRVQKEDGPIEEVGFGDII